MENFDNLLYFILISKIYLTSVHTLQNTRCANSFHPFPSVFYRLSAVPDIPKLWDLSAHHFRIVYENVLLCSVPTLLEFCPTHCRRLRFSFIAVFGCYISPQIISFILIFHVLLFNTRPHIFLNLFVAKTHSFPLPFLVRAQLLDYIIHYIYKFIINKSI